MGTRRFAALMGMVALWAAACSAGEPGDAAQLLPPRGLDPVLRIRPDGVPQALGQGRQDVRLGLVLTLAGRPLIAAELSIYESRQLQKSLWRGRTDEEGRVRPVVPAQTRNRRLPVVVQCKEARAPSWVRLLWEDEPGKITVSWDSTPAVGTAELDKWELRLGSTHVYFDWPNRPGAQAVLQKLLAQREHIRKLLGVDTEPMGAVLITDPDQRNAFIAATAGHTKRHGKFAHGVRTWPLLAATLEELEIAPDEQRELYITLAHELAENTLLAPDSVGIAHEGTRWFRDGVAECAAISSAWQTSPATLARHIETRINDLTASRKNGRKSADLLDWPQSDDDLAKYACATAWFLERQRRSPSFIAGIVGAAAREDRADAKALLAMASKAIGEDAQGRLKSADVSWSIDVLGRAMEDLKAARGFTLAP
jgi:hypothetical protein